MKIENAVPHIGALVTDLDVKRMTNSEWRTLYLPYAGADLAIDSAYTLQVKGYTVSKMPALIPPFPDRFH